MKIRSPIVMNGVNSIECFDDAAQIIASRYKSYDRTRMRLARASVAKGLAGNSYEIDGGNLLFTSSAQAALALSAQYLDKMAQQLKKAVVKAGEPEPQVSVIARGPIEQRIIEPFRDKTYDLMEVSGLKSSDDGNRTEITYSAFQHELLDLFNPRVGVFERSASSEPKPYHFFISYVDMNPSYPDGHIRGDTETQLLSHFFDEQYRRAADYLLQKNIPYPPESHKLFLAIEYCGWYGLGFEDKARSFSQLSSLWEGQTHLVFTTEQYGAAGASAAVLVTPKSHVADFREAIALQPDQAIIASEYFFGTDPIDIKQHEEFFGRQTQRAEENAVIASAIIDGKGREFLEPKEFRLAKSWLMRYGELAENEAEEVLEEGLHGFSVIALPEAGLSLFVDYQGLLNWDAEKVSLDQCTDGMFELNEAVREVNKIAKEKLNLTLGGHEEIGFSASMSVFIMPLSLPPESLIDILMRMRELDQIVTATPPFSRFNEPEILEPIKFKSDKLGVSDWNELEIRPDPLAQKIKNTLDLA